MAQLSFKNSWEKLEEALHAGEPGSRRHAWAKASLDIKVATENLKSAHRLSLTSITLALLTAGLFVSTIAYTIAAWKTYQGLQTQVLSERPYITVHPRYMPAGIGDGHELVIKAENIGKRPARSVTMITVRYHSEPNIEPFNMHSESIVNTIAPGDKPTLRDPIGQLRPNHPPEFVVVEMRYQDSILGGEFSERHYFMWKGASEGEALQAMSHAVPKQVPDLDKGFAKALEEFETDFQSGKNP